MIPHSKNDVMKQHLEQWKASGITQRAYCRQHNIPHHIFSYYKKKLQAKHLPSTTAAFKNQLIPVVLVAQEGASENIIIHHRNGFSFDINPNTQLRELKPLLELLSSVS